MEFEKITSVTGTEHSVNPYPKFFGPIKIDLSRRKQTLCEMHLLIEESLPFSTKSCQFCRKEEADIASGKRKLEAPKAA